ncbi:MAG: DUF4153 domain-containing protein [Clostridiales bacterium]|nr:DUF4153 domain-containing protein [Clostridiales bacterium]
MSEITRSIKKVLTGSMKSFKAFPATIGCAFVFMLVTFVRIHLDWHDQEHYNFLFNCLQWSLAFGAIFSMMLLTGAKTRRGSKEAFIGANIISILLTVVVFIILYNFSYEVREYGDSIVRHISSLAITRVIVGTLVSYLLFIIFSALANDREDIPKALFMNHKAFFIAWIYGLVIIAGVSGVAGAFQALLYQDMSEKVYMYIATITGFIAFTIYLGYFPDFNRDVRDENRELAQKQPKFIEMLFGYIMVPIMIGLSVVLLLWTGRTIISGVQVEFAQLSSIAAVYTFVGIWLHMMVSDHETKFASFYKKFYPVVALVILAFEARALIGQLSRTGLKMSEYWFILLWMVSVSGAILLIVLKARAYKVLIAIICVLAIISVLPITGYHYLPAKAQARRLEKLLISENMLVNNSIIPASKEPSQEVKFAITDAANYLGYANDVKLPEWFNEDTTDNEIFRTVFGFEQTWSLDDSLDDKSAYRSINLYLPVAPIDIRDYDIAIDLGQRFAKDQEVISVEGISGNYQINFDPSYGKNIPSLEIHLNDEPIIQTDMTDLIDKVTNKYSFDEYSFEAGTIDDMTMLIETSELKVLLVFSNIEIYSYSEEEDLNYSFILESLYLLEKDN